MESIVSELLPEGLEMKGDFYEVSTRDTAYEEFALKILERGSPELRIFETSPIWFRIDFEEFSLPWRYLDKLGDTLRSEKKIVYLMDKSWLEHELGQRERADDRIYHRPEMLRRLRTLMDHKNCRLGILGGNSRNIILDKDYIASGVRYPGGGSLAGLFQTDKSLVPWFDSKFYAKSTGIDSDLYNKFAELAAHGTSEPDSPW